MSIYALVEAMAKDVAHTLSRKASQSSARAYRSGSPTHEYHASIMHKRASKAMKKCGNMEMHDHHAQVSKEHRQHC